MSCADSHGKSVFIILPDNTALQFETQRDLPRRDVIDAPENRRSMVEILKSFAPQIARITPKTAMLPSGQVVSLVSPAARPH